jgi:integrase
VSPERKRDPRTGALGNYVFDVILPGVGRVHRSSGTKRMQEFRKREAALRSCVTQGRADLVRAWLTGKATLVQLVEWVDANALPAREEALYAERLVTAFARVLPRMGRSPASRASYARKWHNGVPKLDAVTVGDLTRIDWTTMRRRFGGPTDWNHIGRTVSRFCTLVGGAPLRTRVMATFVKEREREHVPDHTRESVAAVLEAMPSIAARVARVLIYVGARRGEWWGGATLRPQSQELTLTGKTGTRTLPISPAMWPEVAAFVPCAIPYRTFAEHLQRACEAANLPHLRVHDLRHLCGQFMADAGQSEAVIGEWLGNPTMVRRYTKRRLRLGDGADPVALPSHLPPAIVAPGLTLTRKKA